jgi:hypothetical protein
MKLISTIDSLQKRLMKIITIKKQPINLKKSKSISQRPMMNMKEKSILLMNRKIL